MAQMVIRNIPEGVMTELRKMAKRKGASAESEVRELITEAVDRENRMRRFVALSDRLVKSYVKEGDFEDSTALIREDRDR